MSGAPVIDLQGLGVRFGKRTILHGLTRTLSGKSIGLLGPNGAGKTTLLHTLLGFHAPSEGTAVVLGHDVRNDPKGIRSLIGYMPENDAFIPGMTAVRFIRLMGELSGLPPRAATERAHESLFYVGLGRAYRARNLLPARGREGAPRRSPHAPAQHRWTNGLDPPAQRMIG
jgi:ABC-2 type transport system ATP-binding protein